MNGKCLCGEIEFTFEPINNVAMNCHCSICRRSHGADYATLLISKKDSLRLLSGGPLLKEYASSKHGVRAFCSNCGSRLMNYAKSGGNYLSVSLSTVVGHHEIAPSANVQAASKAPWVKLDEALPSFAEFPEDIHKYL